ncbi:type II toxin-antitoxin system HicA family toxin [Rhodobacter sp. NTK016B]|uniref:type II toxin-antitoxin system HicA family toxin n=1 Tax=Rhodobacter sp. NTK016B TaxID=2759676 RepID=UPI001A8C2640|nr:type II toxin-antitoxin system HicA family toxin [Rhodobacter sp. NTK016B]MBN8292848.1 type II toxin-antitoxin system HicA family toxin [Rhodobacter sp. NTK016B]
MYDKMSDGPNRGWTIDDVETLAKQEGMELRRPKRGSHYTLCSEHLRDICTVPYKRPIKVIYIKQVLGYARAHRTRENSGEQSE